MVDFVAIVDFRCTTVDLVCLVSLIQNLSASYSSLTTVPSLSTSIFCPLSLFLSFFLCCSLLPSLSLYFLFFLMATVNFIETFIWTWMRGKKQWQEQKLKFHYLLRSSLGTQLVSALCGPEIFTALPSPPFIVVFLSSRLADCDVITCSLPLAVWDTADNYTISEGPTWTWGWT